MLLWVEPLLWELGRIAGNILTFIGLTGLLLLAGHGLVGATEYIIDKEDPYEDQD